ncbi:hypothetical protein D3C83_282520 [compost metagenome]
MPVSAVVASSSMLIVPGTVSTGASLTAVTLRVTVSVSVLAPPMPVLPPSSMLTVSVWAAVSSAAVV